MPSLMQYRSLPVFIALVCLVAVSGIQFGPGPWYAALDKLPLTPPSWVFPLAWTLLYLLIAVAGWLAWQSPASSIKHRAFVCYAIQLILNAAWSWFFWPALARCRTGEHQPAESRPQPLTSDCFDHYMRWR